LAIWGIPLLFCTPLYMANSSTVPVGILFFKAAEKILKLLEANFKGAENKKR